MRANQLFPPLVDKNDIPSREDNTVRVRPSNAVHFSILLENDLAILLVNRPSWSQSC